MALRGGAVSGFLIVALSLLGVAMIFYLFGGADKPDLAPFLIVMYSAIPLVGSLISKQGIARPFRELGEVRASLREWWKRPGVGGRDVRLMSNDSLDLLGMLPAPVVQEPRDPGARAVFELAAKYRLEYFVVFRIPRYKTGIWDQPRYVHEDRELVLVANLPGRLTEIELDGIAIYEFRARLDPSQGGPR